MRKVLAISIAIAAVSTLTACEGTYKGMEGDGYKFHVYESKAGMGQAMPIASKKDLSCGKQEKSNSYCDTRYVEKKQ